jgi:hypothetical protein
MTRYRVGFRNGMVIVIEAEQLLVVAQNDMRFLSADGKQADHSRFIRAHEVLFVSPAETSQVEKGAVALLPTDTK